MTLIQMSLHERRLSAPKPTIGSETAHTEQLILMHPTVCQPALLRKKGGKKKLDDKQLIYFNFSGNELCNSNFSSDAI